VQEIQELPNGCLASAKHSAGLTLVAEDLNMERLCCPLVNKALEIEPNRDLLVAYDRRRRSASLKIAFESANYFDPQVAQLLG
jgi:hypothetical protein